MAHASHALKVAPKLHVVCLQSLEQAHQARNILLCKVVRDVFLLGVQTLISTL